MAADSKTPDISTLADSAVVERATEHLQGALEGRREGLGDIVFPPEVEIAQERIAELESLISRLHRLAGKLEEREGKG